MKRSILTLSLFSSLALFAASSAFAQSCSVDSLETCLYNGGVTCKTALPACAKNTAAGLSVPDVEIAAVKKCCNFSGSKKKDKQKACFKSLELGLAQSAKTAGPLKSFVKRSRSAIKKVKCSTGSLS